MIAKRLLGIHKATSPPAPAATDVYYDYRSLILNMQGSAGSTTFTDSSPNNLAITAYGNAQLVSDATYGTVASFDGNGDYLSIASNPVFNFGTGDFTVEAWINTSNFGPDKFIASSSGSGGLFFGFDSFGRLGVGRSAIAWDNTVVHGMTVGTLNHVAVTRSAGAVRFFVNGNQIGSVFANTRDYNLSTGSLNLGSQGANYYFNGLIGPLRISPWAVYTANFTPSQDLFPAVQDSTYANPFYDKVALQLKFDGTNGSTSFVDTGPNALAVTAVGNAQISTTQSKFGGASGYFDGSGDYLTASSDAFSFGTGDFTVEYWFNATLNTTYRQVAGNYSTSTSMGFGIIQNKIYATTLTVGYQGTTVLTPGNWYHYAAVRSGGVLRLYLNGVLDATYTVTTSLANSSFFIGAGSATAYPFLGSIDELEVTKGVAKYKSNFTPPARGLSTIYNPYSTLPVSGAALWLDGADSSTLFTDAGVTPVNKSGDLVYQWSDKSGNNRHATQATSGNRPTWVPPASGRNGLGALAFNGTSQFLSLANDPIGTNDFTIEFWMKQGATTNSYWVILDSRISGNALGYPVILYNNSSTNLSFYNNGWLLSGSVATATWTHIAFTRNSGTIRMFINGVLASSNTDSSSYSTFRQLGKAFGPYYFNGQIQNFLIYNGQALYTSNFTPWMS